jgi:hypothetical protein
MTLPSQTKVAKIRGKMVCVLSGRVQSITVAEITDMAVFLFLAMFLVKHRIHCAGQGRDQLLERPGMQFVIDLKSQGMGLKTSTALTKLALILYHLPPPGNAGSRANSEWRY